MTAFPPFVTLSRRRRIYALIHLHSLSFLQRSFAQDDMKREDGSRIVHPKESGIGRSAATFLPLHNCRYPAFLL